MNPDDYGPNVESVQRLIDTCESLSAEQMFDMAEAHRSRGVARGAWEAWAAARTANREQQSGNAAYAVEKAIKLYAMLRVDENTALACGWAANDAGLAAATEDLVGTAGYGKWDHDKLISAWRAGVGD